MMPTEDARERALRHYDTFCRRMLPGTIRRIAAWKGMTTLGLSHWVEEAEQELALDSLQNAAEVVAMTRRERNRRWMRLAARAIYHLEQQGHPCDVSADELACAPNAAGEPVAVRMPPVVKLHNGRPNLTATMRERGVGRRALRRQLDELSTALGWNEDRARFWQHRTAEAIAGLGADVLRQQQRLFTVDDAPPPDPERRRRRLRRIARRLPVHPSTLLTRRALRAWERPGRRPTDARAMLEHACRLAPAQASCWLWLFEACVAQRDLPAAASAIRRARGCADAPKAAITLARARLLEVRGRLPAGLRLLRRAHRRGPQAGLLLRALRSARQAVARR